MYYNEDTHVVQKHEGSSPFPDSYPIHDFAMREDAAILCRERVQQGMPVQDAVVEFLLSDGHFAFCIRCGMSFLDAAKAGLLTPLGSECIPNPMLVQNAVCCSTAYAASRFRIPPSKIENFEDILENLVLGFSRVLEYNKAVLVAVGYDDIGLLPFRG